MCSSDLYGAAGVTKFAHGAAIHALQWLPALAWLGRRRGLAAEVRLRIVGQGVLASALVALASLLQVLLGRSRLDVAPLTLALFLAAAGCGFAAAITLASRRPRPG